MDKTIKTVLAIVGAIAVICGVLLLLKKKFGCCCKKCGKSPCECDKPETVEDFVEEASEAVEKKAEEVKEAVEEAKEKAEDFVEEKVAARITLQSRADIQAVFQMTPYYYRTGPADRAKLETYDTLDTEIEFVLAEYVRE